MVDDLIRYDVLVRDALRTVIRRVLTEVSKAGLPAGHHFFITFLTNAAGVKISSQLKKQYPDQMTIVIQHQYWDLIVNETNFEISLSFNNTPEKLVIPFSSILCFYDPHAAFEAAFNIKDLFKENDINDEDEDRKEIKTQEEVKISQTNDSVLEKSKLAPETKSDSNKGKVVSLSEFRNRKE